MPFDDFTETPSQFAEEVGSYKPTLLATGSCSQFMHGTRGTLHACRITGHEPKGTLIITYRDPDSGELIHGARIHRMDIVSDEDTALHDIP